MSKTIVRGAAMFIFLNVIAGSAFSGIADAAPVASGPSIHQTSTTPAPSKTFCHESKKSKKKTLQGDMKNGDGLSRSDFCGNKLHFGKGTLIE